MAKKKKYLNNRPIATKSIPKPINKQSSDTHIMVGASHDDQVKVNDDTHHDQVNLNDDVFDTNHDQVKEINDEFNDKVDYLSNETLLFKGDPPIKFDNSIHLSQNQVNFLEKALEKCNFPSKSLDFNSFLINYLKLMKLGFKQETIEKAMENLIEFDDLILWILLNCNDLPDSFQREGIGKNSRNCDSKLSDTTNDDMEDTTNDYMGLSASNQDHIKVNAFDKDLEEERDISSNKRWILDNLDSQSENDVESSQSELDLYEQINEAVSAAKETKDIQKQRELKDLIGRLKKELNLQNMKQNSTNLEEKENIADDKDEEDFDFDLFCSQVDTIETRENNYEIIDLKQWNGQTAQGLLDSLVDSKAKYQIQEIQRSRYKASVKINNEDFNCNVLVTTKQGAKEVAAVYIF
jgi:hypothetical protein